MDEQTKYHIAKLLAAMMVTVDLLKNMETRIAALEAKLNVEPTPLTTDQLSMFQ